MTLVFSVLQFIVLALAALVDRLATVPQSLESVKGESVQVD